MTQDQSPAATGGTSDADEDARPITPTWEAPEGATTVLRWAPDGREPLAVTATASWTVLRRKETPAAEVFSVAWTVDDADADRPVTFVFNGGPGASSAYLHVGAVGPRRVAIPDDGGLPAMPVRLVDNDASWLPDTDLVFIDPVGTGFSRQIPSSDAKDVKDGGEPEGYWTYDNDLAAMREFIGRWLSAHGRWASPVFIAGESYGGYRVARLARSLQQEEGVGLAGAILISPALEIAPLTFTDYAIEPFLDALPTMAAGALHHGRSGVVDGDVTADEVMDRAAEFATGPYASFLARGAAADAAERDDVFTQLAAFTGLDVDLVIRLHGRIRIERWVRELLADRREVAGLYDVTQRVVDPFPDRSVADVPDPTLAQTNTLFTMGVNHVLRGEIGVETDRRYELISHEVNTGWRTDKGHHALMSPPGAVDDLRYGMSLNPHLRVLIVHGRHDLVTPLHSSRRLVDAMRLDDTAAGRLDLRAYDGGHMFYTIGPSRSAFSQDVATFMQECLA